MLQLTNVLIKAQLIYKGRGVRNSFFLGWRKALKNFNQSDKGMDFKIDKFFIIKKIYRKKLRAVLSFLCFYLGWASLFNLHGTEPIAVKKGTLIVDYKTDLEGDRLDRIRFWLKDGNHSQKMYPKGNAFVEDRKNRSRIVVLEDVTPGEYTLEFLIPNKDAFFEESSLRHIHLQAGEVVKVDKTFKRRQVNYYSAKQLHEWKIWWSFLSNLSLKPITSMHHAYNPSQQAGGKGSLLNTHAALKGKNSFYAKKARALLVSGFISAPMLPEKTK
ncbi:hypothetical protein NEOC84_001717|nr:hypothetical protein [Neochlamydia sp. AcF84]